jgi:hypothetical protein
MCDVVSRSDEEGLGGIIFWLDAVCKVVLLVLEQASCLFQYIFIAPSHPHAEVTKLLCPHFEGAGAQYITTQLKSNRTVSRLYNDIGRTSNREYHSRSSSWRVKRGNRIDE